MRTAIEDDLSFGPKTRNKNFFQSQFPNNHVSVKELIPRIDEIKEKKEKTAKEMRKEKEAIPYNSKIM